jgi:hypothetical protein
VAKTVGLIKRRLLNMASNIRILIDEGRCVSPLGEYSEQDMLIFILQREMPVMGFLHEHFVTGIIVCHMKSDQTKLILTLRLRMRSCAFPAHSYHPQFPGDLFIS